MSRDGSGQKGCVILYDTADRVCVKLKTLYLEHTEYYKKNHWTFYRVIHTAMFVFSRG